jgi:nucleoside-diphosphate-sugar epimerase
MRLLITGSTGFIGRHLVDVARQEGHEVFGLVRSKADALERTNLIENKLIELDLLSNDEIGLKGQNFDAIIHLAFATSGGREDREKIAIDGTRRICELAKVSEIRKVILVSSISVLDYAAIPQGTTINEQSPVHENRFDSGHYAYLKFQQELIFKDQLKNNRKTEYCIIRPGLVYDHRFIINAHGGLKFGPIKFQISHSGYVPVVEVGYLCKVLVKAASIDFNSGEIVHLLDRNLPSQSQYINGLSKRKLPLFGKVKLPWNIVSWGINLGWLLLPFLYRWKYFPDALRPNEFAGRFKPFSFDTRKADTMFKINSPSNFDS